MIISNKEIVSRLKNQLKLINKDDEISDRFILKSLENVAAMLLSQKLSERSLFRDASLFKEISCVEFKKIDTYSCDIVDFKSCELLYKSEHKIPKLLYTRYGGSIKEIYSIDRKTVLKPSTLADSRRDSIRSGKITENKFFIIDDYIYIPNNSLLRGVIYGIFPDQYDAFKLSSCDDSCESAWDKPFIITSNLLEATINQALQILYINKQIPEDEKANLNSNEK